MIDDMKVASRRERGEVARLFDRDRSAERRDPEMYMLYDAIDALVEHGETDALEEVLPAGFLDRRDERHDELVGAMMRRLGGGEFVMGSAAVDARHFCGEVPRHHVELSPFEIARIPVTNDLFAQLDPRRAVSAPADRFKPVVDVTWLEASLFAIWVGCRLPTEAEWEYACGAGHAGQWCCDAETDLQRYAWYSENASCEIQPVATREPNGLGVFDAHGNVWEWCADAYHARYYARAPRRDPFNPGGAPSERSGAAGHRVCRGGSMHALAEMCRTRYRFHEPAQFWAGDLGFRLARSTSHTAEEDRP